MQFVTIRLALAFHASRSEHEQIECDWIYSQRDLIVCALRAFRETWRDKNIQTVMHVL